MYRIVLRFLKKLTFLPQKIYLPWAYEYYTGKKLDLTNPIEFNQKIQWLKAFYHPKILNQLVDKYEVRSYVEEKIGKEYLNEMYGVYNSYSEIDFDKLPKRFVVKAVHASSYNLICKDKSKLDLKKVKRLFKKWQSTNQYYRTGQEWAYKDVAPKLLVEKFIEDDKRESLTDYKFYCFNGKPEFLVLNIDRDSNFKMSFYDLDFNQLPFTKKGFQNCLIKEKVQKPENFDEMVRLSKVLSSSFPFVRVDFYSADNKTIFGEMTFYPSDGRKDFYPEKYNKIIGDKIELPDLKGENVITTI